MLLETWSTRRVCTLSGDVPRTSILGEPGLADKIYSHEDNKAQARMQGQDAAMRNTIITTSP